MAILLSPDKLSDRYCRIIKEKFAGFNKEFEDIAKTQRSYSIPGMLSLASWAGMHSYCEELTGT